MDKGARLVVLHSLQQIRPYCSIVRIQLLLCGELQHAQAEGKNVHRAGVLILRVGPCWKYICRCRAKDFSTCPITAERR